MIWEDTKVVCIPPLLSTYSPHMQVQSLGFVAKFAPKFNFPTDHPRQLQALIDFN